MSREMEPQRSEQPASKFYKIFKSSRYVILNKYHDVSKFK